MRVSLFPSMRRRPWSRRRVERLVHFPPYVRLDLWQVSQLANNPSLQGEAWRVLLLLLSLLDDENEIVVTTTDLAVRLTVPRQNIWRALTTLARAGCVLRATTDSGIQVSPQVAGRCLMTPEDHPQRPYVRLWQTESLRQLAADRTLHASDLRLCGKILSAVRWLNFVCIPAPQWGMEMGVARQTVWRSLQVLLAKGVLCLDYRIRPGHYVLSYQYGYRGPIRYLSRLRQQEHAFHQLQRLADKP
jgi:biotin operon repressor